MGGNAFGEAVGFASDVMDDYRNDRPPKLLDLAPPSFVTKHFAPPRMPVDAFVFGRQKCVWPCEVDAPQLPVAAADRILKLRRRQSAVDHHEPSLTFHG